MQPNRATLWNRLLPLCALLLAAFPALAGNVAYTYDVLNRLTRAAYSDGTVIEYRYDAAGNRTRHVIQAATVNHTLTVAKAGTGSGTVGGGGSYPAGATITLTAIPDAGSTFSGWKPTPPCAASFTMPDDDLTCTATFTAAPPPTYLLTVAKAGTGSGTVISNPAGINCGTDCSESYVAHTTVTLTATAAAGSSFTGWSGACTGTGTCRVTLGAAQNVTASFTLNPYSLTVVKAGAGQGAVTSTPAGITCGNDCSESYPHGQSVTLTATAAAGSRFTGWAGACTGAAVTCAVHMTEAKTVTATFVPLFTLTVTKAGTGFGAVTSGPAGIQCGADCSENYAANATVTLTATAAAGSYFAGWGGCPTVNGTKCTVIMTASKTVQATFNRPVLTVGKIGTGAGLVTGPGIACGVDCAEPYNLSIPPRTVTLTAAPAAGSTFAGWRGCTPLTNNPRQCTVTLLTAQTVLARFNTTTPGTYALTLYKIGVGLGTVASSPTGIACGAACVANFSSGRTVTLTATPATGSTFTGWTGCAVNPTNRRQCTVKMDTAKVITAHFTRPMLTVAKTGSGSGLITGPGIACGVDCTQPYNLNTPVILTAAPATGSTFAGWSGCKPLAHPRQCTVTLSASRTVKAAFNTTTPGTYALTLYKIGAGRGTVTGSPAGINCGTACVANFPSGRIVTLVATPATGSTFAGWGGACSGTAKTCKVTMNTAKGITATFR